MAEYTTYPGVDRSNVRYLNVGGLLVAEYINRWESKTKKFFKLMWVRQSLDCNYIEAPPKPNPVICCNFVNLKSVDNIRRTVRRRFLEHWKLPVTTIEKEWPVS